MVPCIQKPLVLMVIWFVQTFLIVMKMFLICCAIRLAQLKNITFTKSVTKTHQVA